MKDKLILLIILLILLLIGCQQENQENQEQNIQNCKDMNGNPKITYCDGNSNMICKVECFIENKVGE